MKAELVILLIRNAVADKERWIANMNREQAMGHWLSDWNSAMNDSDKTIQELLTFLPHVQRMERSVSGNR